MEQILKVSLLLIPPAAAIGIIFIIKDRFKSLKNNKFYKLVIVFFIGGFLGFFGLVSSGAGHGPFPKLSIILMVVGAIIAVISFVVLIFYSVYLGFKKLSNK
ncbi:MAG: hypothetical protein PVG89_17975 [Gammaproteobacteria bacterium]|jgi:hypothetical protein